MLERSAARSEIVQRKAETKLHDSVEEFNDGVLTSAVDRIFCYFDTDQRRRQSICYQLVQLAKKPIVRFENCAG